MYDVIRAFDKTNPWDVFRRIGEAFPETLAKCESFKFPGSRGPATPVADFETMIQIVMHVRGEKAAAFIEGLKSSQFART